MTTALGHLRVVEYGSHISAPFSARMFADFGAEVIKVEPLKGDASRHYGPFPGDEPNEERSGLFHYLNAGKKSVAVDLNNVSDREFFEQLLAGADVFIENCSPHERRQWGLSLGELRARHPQLIAISVSPYGQVGPWAEKPGSDITAQAAASLSVALGLPERYPLRLPYDQAEYQAAMHAVAAALTLLYFRALSGEGGAADISVTQVLASMTGAMSLVTRKSGQPWECAGTRLKGGVFPTGFFACKDGFVCMASMHGDQWFAFIELMGNPEWSKDEKMRDPIYLGRTDEPNPAHDGFNEWLMSKTRSELSVIAKETGIILAVVNTPEEVISSAQLEYRDVWAKFELADRDLWLPRPGYLMGKTPVEIKGLAPKLNESGAEIRSQKQRSLTMTKTKGSRSRPLEGLRVLDFGWNWAGPMVGQLLSDMGAEVIRIETYKRQDNMRLPTYEYYFNNNNRGKKSATFNIADPRGVELVKKLACKCDVVLDNFAAGVMAKNGLSYTELSAVNPSIVAVSLSMAGQQGPAKTMRGFACIATAFAGLEGLTGYAEDGKATGLMPFGLGDVNMAIQALIGVLAALIYRQKTGEGQFVDVSQIESSVATLGEMLADYQLNDRLPSVQGNHHCAFFPHGIFAAKGDGRWLSLAIQDKQQWYALCSLLGKTDWAADSSLDSYKGRKVRSEEINTAISAWCAGKSRDGAFEDLSRAGIPSAPMLQALERDGHPVFTERGFTMDHPIEVGGICPVYAAPWGLHSFEQSLKSPAPSLGEHNDYVFKELLGLNPDDIDQLVSEGVLQ